MYHEIIVKRDEERIELIKQRIEEATKLRDNYINELKNNIQWTTKNN